MDRVRRKDVIPSNQEGRINERLWSIRSAIKGSKNLRCPVRADKHFCRHFAVSQARKFCQWHKETCVVVGDIEDSQYPSTFSCETGISPNLQNVSVGIVIEGID